MLHRQRATEADSGQSCYTDREPRRPTHHRGAAVAVVERVVGQDAVGVLRRLPGNQNAADVDRKRFDGGRPLWHCKRMV